MFEFLYGLPLIVRASLLAVAFTVTLIAGMVIAFGGRDIKSVEEMTDADKIKEWEEIMGDDNEDTLSSITFKVVAALELAILVCSILIGVNDKPNSFSDIGIWYWILCASPCLIYGGSAALRLILQGMTEEDIRSIWAYFVIHIMFVLMGIILICFITTVIYA